MTSCPVTIGYIMWKFFNYVICSLQELNMGENINILLSAWGIFHMMFNIYTYSRTKDQKIIIPKFWFKRWNITFPKCGNVNCVCEEIRQLCYYSSFNVWCHSPWKFGITNERNKMVGIKCKWMPTRIHKRQLKNVHVWLEELFLQ